MNKKFDVLVAGEINPDLILTDPFLDPKFGQQEILVDDVNLTIGSSSAIYACGVARLGLKVAIVGIAGDDEFGDIMKRLLQKRDVDTSHVIIDAKLKTGLSVILNRKDDRAILTYLGAIAALQAEMITDELLQQCKHLHVASYFLQNALRPGLPKLFKRAKNLGLSISLDTNWDPTESWAGLNEILSLVDIFLPNNDELLSLTQKESIEEALSYVSGIVPMVVVKMGANGAVACGNGEKIKVESIRIDNIADTVGAGDSFNAGFTYGFLMGWDLKKTLQLAVACGSLSLRQHGGTEAQPNIREALQAVSQTP
jgi:sugar/nucleoside kinase (ribokinase family)